MPAPISGGSRMAVKRGERQRGRLLQKRMDVRRDEIFAGFVLRWRLIEVERGFIDLLAGVRSEKVVPSHYDMHRNPDGITEKRRIDPHAR